MLAASSSAPSRRAQPRLRACGCGALLVLAAAFCASAAPDVAPLIRKLERVPPARLPFAEARFSELLVEPIVVSGELAYLGPGEFERVVVTPHRERTVIRGASVSVERDGERPRTFALRRAPELGALLTSLTALLAGDAAAVARDFTVVASGTDTDWALELVPLASADRRRIERILVRGTGNELRCLAVLGADGGTSVTLLGPSAAAEVTAAASLDALTHRCRSE